MPDAISLDIFPEYPLRPGITITREHVNIVYICKDTFQLYRATLLNLSRIATQGRPVSRFDTVSPSDWRKWWVGLESKQNKALHDTLTTQMSRARDVVLRPRVMTTRWMINFPLTCDPLIHGLIAVARWLYFFISLFPAILSIASSFFLSTLNRKEKMFPEDRDPQIWYPFIAWIYREYDREYNGPKPNIDQNPFNTGVYPPRISAFQSRYRCLSSKILRTAYALFPFTPTVTYGRFISH